MKRHHIIGWLFSVLIGLVLAAACFSCADKKTTREIINLLPTVEKPPVECPKGKCRHGQDCEPCKGDEGD
jgi:hypothetical protein